MNVKQLQKVEGLVGIFDVPVDVEITTAAGRKTFPIEVNQASQSFTFPADGAPLMVLFDKGEKILKTVNFDKEPGNADLSAEKCGNGARSRECRRRARRAQG